MNDSIPAIGQFIEPAPVPFTPDAPGWTLSGIISLLCIFALFYYLWRQYHKNEYRRLALHELEQAEKQFRNENAEGSLAYMANMLMKRLCISQYGRESTSLREKDWIDFLNKTGHSKTFNKDDIAVLKGLYTNELSSGQIRAFVEKTKHWIKTHKYVSRHSAHT